jgi:hypothetical protein
MKNLAWIEKPVLVGLIAALTLAVMPLTSVYAAGSGRPAASRAPDETGTYRLERLWAHQQKIHQRQGRLLTGADNLIARVQRLLERAVENGRDVAALQAALDAFERAVNAAHAKYEEAGAIIAAHAGFDDSGQVTDAALAAETSRQLSDKLQEIRKLVGPPGKALHEALKALREANKPAEAPTR